MYIIHHNERYRGRFPGISFAENTGIIVSPAGNCNFSLPLGQIKMLINPCKSEGFQNTCHLGFAKQMNAGWDAAIAAREI